MLAYCNTIVYNIVNKEVLFPMARTSNIFARVEPDVKEQAETVLTALGIPMSNAIGLFLRQVVMQQGIPFDMKLPQNKPLSISMLTESEFNAEIEKGLADLANGKVVPSSAVREHLAQDFGV